MNNAVTALFMVIKGRSVALISQTTARNFGMLQTDKFSEINNVENTHGEYTELVKDFSDVFNDLIGCLKDC